MTMADPKSGQQESLAGLGRPSIPELDETCLKVMKLEEKKAKIVDALKAANAENMIRMKKARDEDKLEKDVKENHVYVFELGSKLKTCVIKKEDVVSFRDTAKPKLAIVPDDGAEIG